MRKAAALATLTLLLMAGLSSPQSPAQDTHDDKLAVEVELVRIDALVLHREKPVPGLTKDDFEVYEDGVLQEIKYFSSDPVPLSLVIVIDQSGSLKEFFEDVKGAANLIPILQGLAPNDEIAVVGFDGEVRISTNFTADRQETAAILEKIQNTGGETNIIAALRHGIEKLKATPPSKRRAIVLISDNQLDSATMSKVKPDEKQLYRATMANEVALYNIRVGKPPVQYIYPSYKTPGEILVEMIVEKTGGQIIDATKKKPAKALATMIGRLKNTYSLYYAPPNPEKTGLRKVKVKLTNSPKSFLFFKKYQVIARKEYDLQK